MVIARLLFVAIGMLLWSAAAIVSGPAMGAAPVCAPYKKPITLDFKTLAPKATYNNRLNTQGIRNLFREHTDPVLGPHEKALGITFAQSRYGVEAQSSATSVKGGFCVYLTGLDVTFGFKRMDVYVASEFEPGTCEYRSVLDHENQHVAVNNATLKAYAPVFRAEIEKLLARQQPVYTANAQAGMDIAMKNIEQGISRLWSQFQNRMASENAPLDSASNYAATGALCSNWNGATAPR
jgi:hypothetical protein